MTIQAITLPINLELSSKSKALLNFLHSLETDAPAKPTTSPTPPAMGEYWAGQGGRYICTLPALLGIPERHLIVGDGIKLHEQILEKSTPLEMMAAARAAKRVVSVDDLVAQAQRRAA